MKYKTILFYTALLITAAPAGAQIQADHYTTKSFDCAIFPASYPTEFGGKHFTPTHTQADKVEAALKQNLKNVQCNNKSDMREIQKNLAKYKMQMFGYTNKQGDTLLFLNCFRNDKNHDKDIASTWLSTLIQAENGGDYFWTIQYNLTKNTLFAFKENGNWN